MTLGADPDAPAQMLQALAVFLDEGARKGYRFVSISELIELTDKFKAIRPGVFKRLLAWFWLQYESLFHLVFRLKPVEGSGGEPSIHYRKVTYNGPPVELKDGTRIVKGDPVAEMHLDNGMLRRLAARSSSPIAVIIHLIRELETSLPNLAKRVLSDPDTSSVRAIYGVSMLNKGADKLGFQIFDLPDNLFAKVSRIYLRLLFRVLTAAPKRTDKSRKSKSSNRASQTLSPRMLFISREDMARFAMQDLVHTDLPALEKGVSSSAVEAEAAISSSPTAP